MSRTGSILIVQLPEDNCIHSITQMASTEKQLKTLKNLITAGDDITPINYNVQWGHTCELWGEFRTVIHKLESYFQCFWKRAYW